MVINQYILLEILCLCYFGKVYSSVPVLIWESSAITDKEDSVPALSQLDVDEFTNHIVKKIHVHKPLIVVFLEETLSVEDFSWKDTRHKGSFPELKNITSMSAKLEFIPSVDDPITSLKELLIGHDYIWEKYNGMKLPTESGVILLVRMEDPLNNEDRPDLLRRHDGNIAELYSQLLAKHSRIVAIYTGKQSSWVEFESNRVKREAEMYKFNIARNDILIRSTNSPLLIDGANNYTLDEAPEMSYDNRSGSGYVRLQMKFFLHPRNESSVKVILRWKFPKSDGFWSLSEIEYEDSKGVSTRLVPSVNITVKLGNSFISTKPIEFNGGTKSLQFADLQVEAYSSDIGVGFSRALGASLSEGPPFFTAPIWSGLIVSFVLILILTWGITMLLDIKTMDRFDDPKGKTISVSATE